MFPASTGNINETLSHQYGLNSPEQMHCEHMVVLEAI